MISPISLPIDHVKSDRFRLIDAAKLEGVIDGIGKVFEPGLAETVQAEKLHQLDGVNASWRQRRSAGAIVGCLFLFGMEDIGRY